jgi:hypothetical protein
MTSLRKMTSAFFYAFLVATVMTLGSATVEAAGKKPPAGTICSYLEAIINHPTTSPYILAWAMSLYSHFGCNATD